MSVKAETLKGYLLEEAIVYLLRNAGFRLLSDPSQDPSTLEWRGGALCVKGRGAAHHLGILIDPGWATLFTYPVRLWLEGTARAGKAGMEEIRNAAGVLHDINGLGGYLRGQRAERRYHYAYALVSAAGFTKPAAELALSQQISLLDLSGGEYAPLLDAIDKAAGLLAENAPGLRQTGALFDLPDNGAIADNLVTRIRQALRREFANGKEDTDRRPAAGTGREALARLLGPVIEVARYYDELFVGMVNGPYMVLVKADNPACFIKHMTEAGTERVAVTWSKKGDGGKSWNVRPLVNQNAFMLKFRLPDVCSNYFINSLPAFWDKDRTSKGSGDGCIAIYRRSGDHDRIFRLQYDPGKTLDYRPE